MVYVQVGLDAIRDAEANAINEAAIGTDGTSATVSDTSIGSEVLLKNESGDLTESLPASGKLQYTFTVGLSEGNGNTLREVVLRDNNNNELHIRITHAPIPKDNTFELDYSLDLEYTNP